MSGGATHDGGGVIPACPECDRGPARHRTGGPAQRASDGEWRCRYCGVTFDEPHYRPRRATGGIAGDTIAATLDEAHPDDLATDGGRNIVLACPECDDAKLELSKRVEDPRSQAQDARYRCKDCDARFDYPVERPSKGGGRRGPHGRALEQMDPEDLATDGGEEATLRVECRGCQYDEEFQSESDAVYAEYEHHSETGHELVVRSVATNGGRRMTIPEHYWVECRFCGESTVAFERYCRHCDADRQQHRDEDLKADGGMATAWGDLTAFQRDILRAIRYLECRSEQDVYGLAIKRVLEHRRAEDVNHGRLYPNLDQLVERGLISKGEIDKRTNEYRSTDYGRRLLELQAVAFVDDVDTVDATGVRS